MHMVHTRTHFTGSTEFQVTSETRRGPFKTHNNEAYAGASQAVGMEAYVSKILVHLPTT